MLGASRNKSFHWWLTQNRLCKSISTGGSARHSPLEIDFYRAVLEQFYVPAYFVVVETGGNEKAPIILERPFLSTTKAIIYTESAKIYFNINGNQERFNFKGKKLQSSTHPQSAYIYENKTAKKKTNKKKKKNKQPLVETCKMINSVRTEYDYLLKSPYVP